MLDSSLLKTSARAGVVLNRVAGWLSPQEFRLLEMVCDTFFPSLDPPEDSSETLSLYYRRSAQALHLPMLIAETLGRESRETRADLHQFFSLLTNSMTTLLLIRQNKPFSELSQEAREKYLLALANSPLPQLRQGFQALKRLNAFLFFAAPDEHGHNPNWEALDFVPPEKPVPSPSHAIRPLSINADTTLDCDIVVIGSGAGGGVVAGELARAGKSVVLLEKGGYFSEDDFSWSEAEGLANLYLKRGLLSTKDLGVILLAGSALGGGTTVNWTTSFRANPTVLEEWTRSSGLSLFTDQSLQESYAAVEARLQVNTANSEHNRQNQVLYNGAEKLGFHVGSMPRNAVDCEQRCGSCGAGCQYGCKQSTLKTYVQDAYEHGAHILVNCSADHVLIQNGQATGVVACVQDAENNKVHAVTVHAKTVIVAAGALHTPAILLRSGLEHPHLGNHLHIHPVTAMCGVYPTKINPWQGVMQSAYCDEFARLTDNYGYMLEVPPAQPGLLALAAPWHGARIFRERMLDVSHIAAFIVLARDRGEGFISLDHAGEPVVNYVTSVFDRRHLLHGMRNAARVHLAANAHEVFSLHSRPTSLARVADQSASPTQLRDFDAQLERHGLGPNRLTLFSAHQMGTCRMGADPTTSVTDEHGAVHGVKGLYVCDSSVFPSASGVNPMLTIMALAHRSAQYIKTV